MKKAEPTDIELAERHGLHDLARRLRKAETARTNGRKGGRPRKLSYRDLEDVGLVPRVKEARTGSRGT